LLDANACAEITTIMTSSSGKNFFMGGIIDNAERGLTALRRNEPQLATEFAMADLFTTEARKRRRFC
jgi:hypothetical protein